MKMARLYAVLQLMINRAESQFALERLECHLHLRQLDIPVPQHRRIFRHQIRSQQIVAIAQLSLLQLLLVDLEGEGLAGDLFPFLRYTQFDKSKPTPGFLLGSSHAQ